MTDFPDWQAPQAHADAIAVTGVPLLTGSTTLNSSSNSVPASSSISLGPFTVTQIGYELVVSCLINNSATNPFVTVILTWIDSASGVEVSTDSFSTVCGDASLSFLPTTARGPSKADQLSVTIHNNDTGFAATVDVVLLQNSRVYQRDDIFWVNQYPNTLLVPVFTLATQPPDESVLGILSSQTVAASTNKNWLFGLAPGKQCTLSGNTAGATPASVTVTVFAYPQTLYGAGAVLLRSALATAAFSFTFTGSRSPLIVNWSNAATTTLTVSSIVTAQQP